MAKKKRPTDIWNEIAEDYGELTENRRENFVLNVARQKEGISADREKFITGTYENMKHKMKDTK